MPHTTTSRHDNVIRPDQARNRAKQNGNGNKTHGVVVRGMPILSTIASGLVVLWIFGVVGLFYIGSFIHLLLLAAILLAVVRVWQEYDVSVAEFSRMWEREAREFVSSRTVPFFHSWILKSRPFFGQFVSVWSKRNFSFKRRTRSA